MAKTKKAAGSGSAKPIADVAHPGTTAPSETSKPIITHRSMVKDPMVVEDDKPQETLSGKTTEVTVVPPNEPEAAVNTDEKPEEPATVIQTPESAEVEAPKPDTPPEDKADDKDKKPSKSDQDIEVTEAAKDAKLQQLIDNKKYFLPINSVEQRRSKRVVTLGIVVAVLLALAWVNIALDAGLIHLDGVRPLTHFFSN